MLQTATLVYTFLHSLSFFPSNFGHSLSLNSCSYGTGVVTLNVSICHVLLFTPLTTSQSDTLANVLPLMFLRFGMTFLPSTHCNNYCLLQEKVQNLPVCKSLSVVTLPSPLLLLLYDLSILLHL